MKPILVYMIIYRIRLRYKRKTARQRWIFRNPADIKACRGMHTIEMFCRILHCRVEDVMEYIED